jgi:co-chaperonin GroES (HSP10)
MKIRPLHDRLLVERVEKQEVRQGGIIIPDTAKEKPQEGRVVAAGRQGQRRGQAPDTRREGRRPHPVRSTRAPK